MARPSRSGILIVSSGLGTFPCAGWLALSIVKSLQSFLGRGLNYELRNKIDVTSFDCGEVVTQTNTNPPTFFRCMPNVATEAALRDMGKEAVTAGTWRQEFRMWSREAFMTTSLQNKVFYDLAA